MAHPRQAVGTHVASITRLDSAKTNGFGMNNPAGGMGPGCTSSLKSSTITSGSAAASGAEVFAIYGITYPN